MEPDLKKKIVIVFDFDDTLCKDSTTAYLADCGVNTRHFWEAADQKILEGFDPVLAYMNLMISYSRKKSFRNFFTQEHFKIFGRGLKFHKGVKRLIPDLKNFTRAQTGNGELECYLVSSGIRGIIAETPIHKHFKGLFASDFIYTNTTGRIAYPKRVVGFTDKTRFLFSISKGVPLAKEHIPDPFLVNQKHATRAYDVPFKNIIYVGDGYSDVPAFAILKAYGGYGLAIQNDRGPGIARSLLKEDRVLKTALPDFTENGPVRKILCNFIKTILSEK